MAVAALDTDFTNRLRRFLDIAYSAETRDSLATRIMDLVETAQSENLGARRNWVDQTDVMLITYGDSIRKPGEVPLATLDDFLRTHVADVIGNVHILPFYPWTSDDGFSVVDYREIDPDLGDWADVRRLAEHFGLMFDAVINHISSKSAWFEKFRADDPQYRDYFHVCDPAQDYSTVTRPRALPLLTEVGTAAGPKHVWTTFSDDQIDLNYSNPDVLIEILDLLLFYARQGARFIRLDAIGFLWKRLGTTCMHLPETHALIQVMRLVLDTAAPGVLLITETNVPHADNISYFGDGTNEAQLVYQFPLPPLTLHAFQTGNARPLSDWAAGLETTSPTTTYFNFLSSHDGIGVRPVEGLLAPEEVAAMAAKVEANGGRVSLRNLPGGGTAPYELNIAYLDAIAAPEDDDAARAAKFLAAQTILLSVVGVPGIYIHSLLGSRSDHAGLARTGRNRSINREKLDRTAVERDLEIPEGLRARVLEGHRHRLALRRSRPAFHPNAAQRVVPIDDGVLSLVREGGGDRVWAAINVSNAAVPVSVPASDLGFGSPEQLHDLISGTTVSVVDDSVTLTLPPHSAIWIADARPPSD
ncbi:MAG: DUF3459 domain-containing protein [Rhodobacteraceae bacterium]|nr:DUF3459 domain-containing protein [Paracoccaceae bacterium]